MANRRLNSSLFIAHVVALVVMAILVGLLTYTYMKIELAHLRPLVLGGYITSLCVSNLLGGLAIKRIRYSPWLGLTGFAVGLIPLILYLSLPEKHS
jgi:hypothetical protein